MWSFLEGIFNNGWFVNITGSIVASFIMFLITRFFTNWRGRKDYLSNVAHANTEMLGCFRQNLPTMRFPKRSVIHAILAATARKYTVRTEDMFALPDMGRILTKEVMDNHFITPDVKMKYYSILERELINEPVTYSGRDESMEYHIKQSANRRAASLTMLTMLLTFTVIFFMEVLPAFKRFGSPDTFMTLLMLVGSVFASTAVLLGLEVFSVEKSAKKRAELLKKVLREFLP